VCSKTYALGRKLSKVNHYATVTVFKCGLGECSGEGVEEYVETRGKRREIGVDIF
jgi:hypothetical protein